MPFVNGQYTAPASSWNPAVPGTTIESAAYNSQLSDIETALSTCVLKDGTQTITANIPMSGFKFTGVNTNSGNTSRSEFVSGATYQDGSPIDAGLTAGSSTVYTASLTPAITAYADKQCFRVQFDEACGNNPTINFNSVGAKKIYKNVAGTATQLSANDVFANTIGELRYDTALDGAAGGFWLINLSTSGLITLPLGRLTLTSATPVISTDVTGATTVYYTPYQGNNIPIYSGSWATYTFSELSLALDNDSGHTGYQQSGKNFDLFVVNDSGTLRLGTGPAWSSDTARGTGAGTTQLTQLNGVWVNTVTMTLRFGSASGNTVSVTANYATYVGTMRATANGQTTMQFNPAAAAGGNNTIAGLWNAYNRVFLSLVSQDNTASWTYGTATTWRAANNNTNNRINYVDGLGQSPIMALYSVIGQAGASSAYGIGLASDWTTGAPNVRGQNGYIAQNTPAYSAAHANVPPSLGYHNITALEWNLNTTAGTFFGANANLSAQTQVLQLALEM